MQPVSASIAIQIAERGGSEAGYPLSDQRIQDEYRRAIDHTGLNPFTTFMDIMQAGLYEFIPLDSACGRVGLGKHCEAVRKACYGTEIPRFDAFIRLHVPDKK